MITRLSEVLGVDVNVLFHAAAQSDENLIVIMVDDNKVILNGGLPIIKWASCSSRSRPMA